MNNKNTLYTTNRALIKRVDLLPNVSEFNTTRLGVHEYAAMYGIEKTRRSTEVIKLHKGQPNRYLERVAYTLTKYAIEDRVTEFNKLSEITQRKSIAFRVLALNRTIDNWFTLPIKKLDKIWRDLSHICRTNSSELKFKRVWIDKKPGDYARPLGVPTPAWRCWSYMKMDHLERFYKGSGRLASWQHGGRSGVGVLSCYKQLIPRITTSNTIYEFDIKGFFDNIKHETIIQRIKETLGIKVSKWVTNILKAKPEKYVLPPEEDDKALQDFKAQYPLPGKNASIFETEWKVTESHGPQTLTTVYQNNLRGVPSGVNPEDITPAQAEFYKELYKVQSYNRYNVTVMGDDNNFGMAENAMDLMEWVMSRRHQDGNTGKPQEFRSPIQPLEREKARDSWKNLGQPGKGVPQGLGTSPFLSTFMTDITLNNLKENIIMYMDDGILFAENKAEMEKLINILKGCLDHIGLEIAPEKSKYVKIDGKWVESLKFLGLRYLPEKDSFTSDTRSGTKVLFPSQVNWSDFKALAELNNSSIYTFKQKFDKMINTTAYEAGLKYGFLGCLIAGSQYKEEKSMEERREDIRKGQNSAWTTIENSKGFIWKFQDLHSYTEYLTNVSSIQVHKFMSLNSKGGKLYHYQGRKHRRELLK